MFSDEAGGRADAGTIDRRIDRAHALRGAVDGAIDCGFVGDIRGDEGGAAAESRGRCGALHLIHIEEGDDAAGLYDFVGYGEAESRGAAGDHGA